MIKLSPTETLYFKELLTGAKSVDVAKKLRINPSAIGGVMCRLSKRIGMPYQELIQKYKSGEIEVQFSQKFPLFKYPYKDMRVSTKERIYLMRKLGFTDAEIKKELKDK